MASATEGLGEVGNVHSDILLGHLNKKQKLHEVSQSKFNPKSKPTAAKSAGAPPATRAKGAMRPSMPKAAEPSKVLGPGKNPKISLVKKEHPDAPATTAKGLVKKCKAAAAPGGGMAKTEWTKEMEDSSDAHYKKYAAKVAQRQVPMKGSIVAKLLDSASCPPKTKSEPSSSSQMKSEPSSSSTTKRKPQGHYNFIYLYVTLGLAIFRT